MVEMTMTARQKARAERLRVVAGNQTAATVKVFACSPEIHAVLRHPSAGRMRGDFGTATEWPHDSFTHRRLLDGTLSLDQAKQPAQPDETIGPRQAAYAMRPDPASIGRVKPASQQEAPKAQRASARHASEPAA